MRKSLEERGFQSFSANGIRFKGHTVDCELTGIGKVNCAVNSMSFIYDRKPDLVILQGCCGALPGLNIGDVVQITGAIQYDFDLTAFGNPLGYVPRERTSESEYLVKTNYWVESLPRAVCYTADKFCTDVTQVMNIRNGEEIAVVDMESFAFIKACNVLGKKAVVIKAVSDLCGHGSVQVEQYYRNRDMVCKKASDVVASLVYKIMQDGLVSSGNLAKWVKTEIGYKCLKCGFESPNPSLLSNMGLVCPGCSTDMYQRRE